MLDTTNLILLLTFLHDSVFKMNSYLLLIIALISVKTECLAYPHFYSFCDEQVNGEVLLKPYNTAFELCCHNTLQQRTQYLECCGNQQTYFSNEEICCNGRLSPRWVSNGRNEASSGSPCQRGQPHCVEQTCCGKDAVQKRDNILCCQNNIVHLSTDQTKKKDYLSCCGRNAAYDKSSEICCDERVYTDLKIGCCNKTIFEREKFKCIHNELMKRTERFCGQRIYDATTSTCCEKQVIENKPEMIKSATGIYMFNPDVKCCGSNLLNQNETCCEKGLYGFHTHSIPKQPNLKCCGSGYYNSAMQLCLNGTAIKRLENQSQCGNKLINRSFQGCCNNKLPYNKNTEECCEGEFHCVIQKGQTCCNGYKQEASEICCEGIKPCKKQNNTDDSCCYNFVHGSGKTYNTKEQTCHEGEVLTIPKGTKPCGRNNYYDPKQEFCCDEKKYRYDEGQCCNGVFSHVLPEKGRCCDIDSQVYGVDDTTNPCVNKCGKENYNVNYKICCGVKPIDPSVQECCGDQFPYYRQSHKKCCHNTQLYNERHSLCTNDGRVEFKNGLKGLSDVQKLCHPLAMKLIDGVFQHACVSDYAITGKIASVLKRRYKKNDLLVILKIKKARTLNREIMKTRSGKLSRTLRFKIHIPGSFDSCQINHLKQSDKVIILFDSPYKRALGKKVDISLSSSFLLTKRTYLRRFAVTKAVTRTYCKPFWQKMRRGPGFSSHYGRTHFP